MYLPLRLTRRECSSKVASFTVGKSICHRICNGKHSHVKNTSGEAVTDYSYPLSNYKCGYKYSHREFPSGGAIFYNQYGVANP